MINIYNESNLHKTFKEIYAENDTDKVEAEADGHIYDILREDGSIIEIQTQGLSKLLPKISDALSKNRRVTVVHPLAVQKTILLNDLNGKKIYSRKSPDSKSIYAIFRELTGLYPVLLEDKFTLEVPLVKITEIRIRTEEPVQSKNKRRRFKRNWLKTNKRLDEIMDTMKFKTASDYLALLPQSLAEPFTASELKTAMIQEGLSRKDATNAHLILWVLARMNLIEHIGSKNKSRVYKINSVFFNNTV